MEDNWSQILDLLEKSRRSGGTWEERLRGWAKPPSDTETEKCERAVRMVKQAIAEDPKLSNFDITVFGKGSFANRTNIPSESDVDVGVVANSYYFNEYPPGMSDASVGLVNSPYSFEQFKQDVVNAIVAKFGRDQVTIGDKSIKVHSNTARVDADVVPHFVHRRFGPSGIYVQGVAMLTKNGEKIYNWPQQDYDNGVAKNERSKKRYKAIVRVMKTLRAEMEDAGYASAKGIPSYLLACLVWNVPGERLTGDTYAGTLTNVLEFLRYMTSHFAQVQEWGEVNELKYLFRTGQAWTLAATNAFLVAACEYAKEKNT